MPGKLTVTCGILYVTRCIHVTSFPQRREIKMNQRMFSRTEKVVSEGHDSVLTFALILGVLESLQSISRNRYCSLLSQLKSVLGIKLQLEGKTLPNENECRWLSDPYSVWCIFQQGPL